MEYPTTQMTEKMKYKNYIMQERALEYMEISSGRVAKDNSEKRRLKNGGQRGVGVHIAQRPETYRYTNATYTVNYENRNLRYMLRAALTSRKQSEKS